MLETKKQKLISVLTIICYITVIFIPIGVVLMCFASKWNKKLKIILGSILSALYIALIVLFLCLEPSYNTSGLSLPIDYNQGYTESSTTSSSKKSDKINKSKSSKSSSENEISTEEIPDDIDIQIEKNKGSRNLGRSFFILLFFLLMIFLIVLQNMKEKKKQKFENPYVDLSKYTLPLTDDSKLPIVHYLRLNKNPNEKILFASETRTKDNKGDFVITNQRVVCYGSTENYEFPLSSLEAAQSISNTVLQLTSGTRKHYIIFPENQLKYALAILRWTCAHQEQ